jgi:hypothetical protein
MVTISGGSGAGLGDTGGPGVGVDAGGAADDVAEHPASTAVGDAVAAGVAVGDGVAVGIGATVVDAVEDVAGRVVCFGAAAPHAASVIVARAAVSAIAHLRFITPLTSRARTTFRRPAGSLAIRIRLRC